MTSVTVNGALQSLQFPAATPEVANIRIALLQGGAEVQSGEVAPTDPVTFTFPTVAPGDYTASAQSVAADGTAIGSAMTADFNVPLPDVGRQVPASVSVTLGA